MAFGVYVHWPYCLSKCPYCDFYKEVKKNVPQEEIVEGYLKELDFYRGLSGEREVSSIFFGGGTPSLIEPKYIQKIIERVAKNWVLSSKAEVSLEANPNSHYDGMFKSLRGAGINRLSLGVQALDDTDLRFLGRTHSLAEAETAISEVLENFDNHSMDLIYARPNQSPESWEKELEKTVWYGFRHLSLYQLTIEEGTVFQKKGIRALDDEKAAEQYLVTEDVLKKYGYRKYEVSNYAKAGFESRHNMLYWQGDDYVGVGPSAHGRISGGGKFFATTHDCQVEELTRQERAEELLIMGMRLTEGIDKKKFMQIIGQDFRDFVDEKKIAIMAEEGLILDSEDNIKPTKEGFPVLNKLIEEIARGREPGLIYRS